MDTKSVNLTEEEIKMLMNVIAMSSDDVSEKMERLNYLHKRLKSFNEVETKPIATAQAAASQAWPSN